MTIHLPTRDLVGILSDVIPFASADKDDTMRRSVRFEWDGETLSAQATDGHHFAISTWHPDDDVPEEADDLPTTFIDERGNNDSPWSCVITLDDAKTLVKDYRLPPKQGLTPLNVGGNMHSLAVSRNGAAGPPAKTTRIEALHADDQVAYPNLAKLLSEHVPSPTMVVAFNIERLAHFGKVRQVGPMVVTLAGADGTAVVTIGARFVGGISTSRIPGVSQAIAAQASDFLRNGSGVHLRQPTVDVDGDPFDPFPEGISDEPATEPLDVRS